MQVRCVRTLVSHQHAAAVAIGTVGNQRQQYEQHQHQTQHRCREENHDELRVVVNEDARVQPVTVMVSRVHTDTTVVAVTHQPAVPEARVYS